MNTVSIEADINCIESIKTVDIDFRLACRYCKQNQPAG